MTAVAGCFKILGEFVVIAAPEHFIMHACMCIYAEVGYKSSFHAAVVKLCQDAWCGVRCGPRWVLMRLAVLKVGFVLGTRPQQTPQRQKTSTPKLACSFQKLTRIKPTLARCQGHRDHAPAVAGNDCLKQQQIRAHDRRGGLET